jgi:hypothetical protein
MRMACSWWDRHLACRSWTGETPAPPGLLSAATCLMHKMEKVSDRQGSVRVLPAVGHKALAELDPLKSILGPVVGT